jgi:hypothetical protein
MVFAVGGAVACVAEPLHREGYDVGEGRAQVTDLTQGAAACFRAPGEARDLGTACHELIELGAQFMQLDCEVHDVTVKPNDRQQRRGADDVGDLRLVVGSDARQDDCDFLVDCVDVLV